MIYCFDIDGTICSTEGVVYERAQPFHDVIGQVNHLNAEGNRILLFTARGTVTGIDWRELTEKQLNEWGVQYHSLYMGKPAADVYIDDKAFNAQVWRQNAFQLVHPETNE